MRQPNWTRDEFIIALDVCFQIGPDQVNKNNTAVIQLSKFLRSLPIHKYESDNNIFRNPDGVAMQLQNFVALDKSTPRKGLPNSGKIQKQVWSDFCEHQEYLHEVAEAIRNCLPLPFEYSHLPDIDQNDFMEGTILCQFHKYIECNPVTVNRLLRNAKSEGMLSCSICGFNFFDNYGKIGKDFIECHHTLPVVRYTKEMKVNENDFWLVCSNCHRMLHRRER